MLLAAVMLLAGCTAEKLEEINGEGDNEKLDL
jgi:hypothetical protein